MESIETIKQKSFGEVKAYVLTELPKMLNQIADQCQNQQLDMLQMLGFCEASLNGLIVGAGLVGQNLIIRWPKNYDILFSVREESHHDWLTVPSNIASDPEANLYLAAVKATNAVFNYMLDHVDGPTVNQMLTQALKQGLSDAKQNNLQVKAKQNPMAYLLAVTK